MDNYRDFTKRFLEELLVHLGDINYQNRIWVMGEGPECDSFDDSVCEFDYYVTCIKDDYKKYGLSSTTYYTLLELESMIDEFCNANIFISDSEVVLKSEWHQIVKLTQQVCKQIEKDIEYSPPATE